MLKKKGEVSIINKILIAILVIICVFAVVLILMTQLNKKSVETYVKETQGIIQNYATTEESTWDVSKNADGSVIATLSEDGTLIISGTGNMKDWKSGDTTDWHNSEIKTKIKNVVINEGVTNIGDYAFYRCSNLKSIEIPTNITSIGYYAFSWCSSLTIIEIPNGVTSIGDWAFKECSSLISIAIPSSVTKISGNAFSECSSIIEIKVDENNTQYMDDNGVLYTKDKIQIIKYPAGKEDNNYIIPNSVVIIGERAFSGCSRLRNIEIPNRIITIGNYAFSACNNLTNINIPITVNTIGNGAFYGCKITKLVNKEEQIELPDILQRTQNEGDILYSSKELYVTNGVIEGTKVVINENETYAKVVVKDGYLEGLEYVLSYEKLDISENGDGSVIATLAEDGTLTISGTGNMKDWKSGDTTDWHNSEFEEKVKNVVIKKGVTNVGAYAFYYCRNLANINIPEGVTSIGRSAFSSCSSLTSIEIPNGVTSIGGYAFSSCSSLTSVEIPNGVTSINYRTFLYCGSLTNIKIPNSITSVGESAFASCKNLESINIPEGVKSIEYNAFLECSSMIEIKVNENNPQYMDDNGVLYTKDGKKIIKYPEGKEDITYTILEGVTSIGERAFAGCKNLESINIPSSVTKISGGAFYGCSSMIEIKVNENNTQYMDDNGVLYTKDGKKIIKYPEGKEGITYTILEGVTSIGGMAFASCKNLESINIPESVTSMETFAFLECSSLTSIDIPEGVISIGSGAFQSCRALTSIVIPLGITEIDQTFYGCTSLTSIIIPFTVTNIGWNTFSGCRNLTIICNSDSTAQRYAIDNSINYEIDDTASTITYGTNGNSTVSKTQSTKVQVIDTGAGVNKNSLKYIWTTESKNITKDQIVHNFQNGETLNIKDVTGTYYLWIYAKDNLGNENTVRSEAFVLDNTVPEAKIGYNLTEKTNQNVQVTITANEEVQSVSNWVLSQDQKVLTKEFEQNTTETVIIKDIAGNEAQVEVEISNIDKTAPTAQVSYSTSEPTKENVTVTITADEEMQAIEGWTLSQDKKISTKEFSENTTEIITIKDIAGNEAYVEIKISNIDKVLPIADVSYSTTELTNEEVKVTITVNEEIQEVEEWDISIDKKTITKIYTNNTIRNIIIKDIAGNETIVNIKITNITDETAPTAQVSYSTTNPTKENITVTITADEEVQAIEGWTLSQDKKILTKEYSENKTETITIKDIVGNETHVEIRISNIDNIAPETEISYSITEPTRENITVTITADEEVQAIEGWTLSQDKKILTKEYSENTTETITIKDIVGNETQVEVNISNIDKIVSIQNVSYSTTEPTRENIIATIITDEEIQEVSGWILSTDKKVLTKEFTQNTTEKVIIKDIAGNETQVEVKISNIDKTAPTAKIDYIQETNEKVKVTITANEEVQAIEGWILSQDKKVLTKEYFENTAETVTIKDIVGNERVVQIKVTGIIKFKENTYKIKGNYVIDIQPKTTYEKFIKNIDMNSEYKVIEDNQQITGKTLIKTGQQLIIEDKTFTLVVTGDTNGDGQANLRDILAINKHRLNKSRLVNEYLQAGDINEDGKVNLRDILQINKYRLGKISEL